MLKETHIQYKEAKMQLAADTAQQIKTIRSPYKREASELS